MQQTCSLRHLQLVLGPALGPLPARDVVPIGDGAAGIGGGDAEEEVDAGAGFGADGQVSVAGVVAAACVGQPRGSMFLELREHEILRTGAC